MSFKVTVTVPCVITPVVSVLSIQPSQLDRNATFAALQTFTAQSTWGCRWSDIISMCCAHVFRQVCISMFIWELGPLLCISCCVLYTPGQNPTRRRRCGDHQYREYGTFTKDAEMDVTRAKQQGQRKSNNSSSTANSDVILPKIVNRWQTWEQMVLLF